jgi:hypothetical protein
MLKDNSHNGDWNLDLLKTNFSLELLEKFDLDFEMPVFREVESKTPTKYVDTDEIPKTDHVYQEPPPKPPRELTDSEKIDANEEDRPPAAYLPEVVFPSNNPYEIPTLRLDRCALYLRKPFVPWKKLTTIYKLTSIHFYTWDHHFEKMWQSREYTHILNNPDVECVVEPNYSLRDETPYALGLQQIYKKRYVARVLQEAGIMTYVDMNVAAKFREANMLGVPDGWTAYATRGYAADMDAFAIDFDIAQRKAGGRELLFVVYAGGKKVQDWCFQNNAIYLPNVMHALDEYKAEQNSFKLLTP